MPNIIDRLIAAVAPIHGLRRHTARQMLDQAQRAYEGASPRDGWKPRRAGASANTDQSMDGQSMRQRARSLYQNVGYITRGVESKVANVVGTGITPNSLAPNADKVNALWAEWISVADADGTFDLYGMMAAAYRAMVIDGEVLIRKRPRRLADGYPVPLQLQLLEIDWLDTSKTGTNGGNSIIAGIEYNPLGKRVAYWLFDQHPGEQIATFRGRSASKPIPADSIIHLYSPERPGQGRGITDLASIIARTRDLETYDDSERARKNLESRLSVLASGDIALIGENPTRYQSTDAKSIGNLAGGSIVRVPDGVSLTVVEPKAVPGFADYYKLQQHIIASGMGVTYEMLTGDVSQVNFSSARVAMLEFRRGAEQIQWLVLVPKMCMPIWSAFLDAAELAGVLPPGQSRAVDWATPKWDYVNPVQDVNADLDEISGGLSSISEKLRRRGYKPDLVFKELKSDLDRLQKDGTLDLLVMLQKGRTLTEATPQPSDQN